jgi:hypothetical protein
MGTVAMIAVIFAGPSLPPRLRPCDPSLCWQPPVRQSELYKVALEKPAIIGIVDGYFEVVPTVWHKEILWAMAQGIHVYGAASIGALRAAELHTFGMVGIGRIFEAFRDGVLEDDDEVAVLHGPEELGYPPVTEALVNIRATLDAAVAASVLDPALAVDLAQIAKLLFYKERSWDAVLRLGIDSGLPPAAIDHFLAWFKGGRVDQKRADALEMTAAIQTKLGAGIAPLTVSYRFHDTGYHQAAMQQSLKRGRRHLQESDNQLRAQVLLTPRRLR